MERKLCYTPICWLFMLTLLFFSCGENEQSGAQEQTEQATKAKTDIIITVYTYAYGPTEKAIFAAYSKAYSAQVNVVHKPAKALVDQVIAEAENCPADIILLDDAAYLFQLKSAELSRVLISNKLEFLELRDPEGYWFATSQRGVGVAYAKDRVESNSLKSYAGLAQLPIKIAKPDTKATAIRSFFGSIIARIGYNKAKSWADELATKFVDTDDFMKSITNGTADLAFINSNEYLQAIKNQPELANAVGFAFLENEKGYHSANISGLIFARYAKNISYALRFIEFVTSKHAQQLWMDGSSVYPVNNEVKLSKALKSLGEFKPDPLDLESLGLQQSQAVKLMKEW